jgi:putative hydrolase of the HAD superfamily
LKATWIFDLDNTLHDTERKLFPIINKKMNRYIQDLLEINEYEADKIRQDYWMYYGSTLKGLMMNYDVNPNNFLDKTHGIKNYKGLIFPAYNLVKILSKLDGRKILFTNAPRIYARNIINHCNIGKYFEDFHYIENSKFNGKPSKNNMKKFLSKYRIEQAYFVDDEKENLKVAKYCGIKTIWINKSKKKPVYIDKKITSLKELQKLRLL